MFGTWVWNGHVTAWMDRKTGRPAPTPDEWKKAIITFEGEGNIEVTKD
jgi:hypothetical protein